MSTENRPSTLPERHSGGLGRAGSALGRARGALRPGLVAGGLTILLAVSALLLAYSQFQDLFKIVSPEGVVLNAPLAVRDGIDQHGWALVLLAAAAIAGGVLAWASGQPLPAWGAVVIAVIALVITLGFDLPDATSEGLTGGGKELGEAEPAEGLWLQLAASVGLLVSATALALVVGRSKARSAERRARQATYQR
jgi:MFS superfamily sulfate permease-like transporter